MGVSSLSAPEAASDARLAQTDRLSTIHTRSLPPSIACLPTAAAVGAVSVCTAQPPLAPLLLALCLSRSSGLVGVAAGVAVAVAGVGAGSGQGVGVAEDGAEAGVVEGALDGTSGATERK